MKRNPTLDGYFAGYMFKAANEKTAAPSPSITGEGDVETYSIPEPKGPSVDTLGGSDAGAKRDRDNMIRQMRSKNEWNARPPQERHNIDPNRDDLYPRLFNKYDKNKVQGMVDATGTLAEETIPTLNNTAKILDQDNLSSNNYLVGEVKEGLSQLQLPERREALLGSSLDPAVIQKWRKGNDQFAEKNIAPVIEAGKKDGYKGVYNALTPEAIQHAGTDLGNRLATRVAPAAQTTQALLRDDPTKKLNQKDIKDLETVTQSTGADLGKAGADLRKKLDPTYANPANLKKLKESLSKARNAFK